jgi:GLPGLI family protein
MLRATFLAFALLPLVASAQQGVVRYSHTYALLAFPTDQINEHVVAIGWADAEDFPPGPTQASIARILTFGPSSSLMYPAEELYYEPGDRTADGTQLGWEFIDTTYVNRDNDTFVESRKFVESKYLVKDELPSLSWRLGDEERSYLGYRVMNATAVVESAVVEAWFTPEIPVSAGPGLYGGLPGLILMVTDAINGEVYAAESIDLDVPPSHLMPPTAGREIGLDKYDQRVAWETAENQQLWERARDVLQ